ncbi:MAG: MATE family efflux transporter [Chloroflexi bacterium]|nr:MATE family efflux transporter [Chloroflexota bacterium]
MITEPRVETPPEGRPAEPEPGVGRGQRRSAYAERDLTTGSIPRNLAFLGWPQVAEGAFNSLDQLLDIFWAAHGAGARGIASLGIAQNYIMFLRLGRQGIDMGIRAMVARSVGAGDLSRANHVVLQGFTINLLLALCTIVPGVIFTEFLLHIVGASDALIAVGATYMKIQLLASAIQGLRMMTGAALQAAGDTLTPMKATMTARGVDWIATPIVIFGWLGLPASGLIGIAVVNIISNTIGFSINTFGLLTGTSKLRLTFRGYRLDFPLMGRMVTLGLPASVTQAERALAQLFVIGMVATYGDVALAAWALARRLEAAATMASQGLGNATGVISGQNIGAGRPERGRQTLYWAVGYILVLNGVLGALLLLFPTFFISLFNPEPELLEVGTVWLRILAVGFLLLGPANIFQQTFQISGDTLMPMLTVLVTVWFLEIPMAAILSGLAPTWSFFGLTLPLPVVTGLGQFGVAWAISLGVGTRLFFYVPYFIWGPWTQKRLFGEAEELPHRP